MPHLNSKERRRKSRIYKHDQIKVNCAGVGDETEASIAQVMNLSDGGMNFITAVAFPKGGKLTISNHNKEFHARVLDCRKCINGYTVRAEFNKL